MSEKLIHSFEDICPLTYYGIYGIKKNFNMPNFPCSDKTEHGSLKKHLMYKHNLSNTAANKIVLDRMNSNDSNQKKSSNLTFHSTQELFSHSVHWHKGQCPFSYNFNNVFNLTYVNHSIKNFHCRHRKQCLLLSHLRVSHNLNMKSAKKIVHAMMSSSIGTKQKLSIEDHIRELILFQKDEIVSNTNQNVYNDDRRFRDYCPLTNNDFAHQQTLVNIPCTKVNEKFLLFAHLQHYHQMNGEFALRLIRSIRMNNQSLTINDTLENLSDKNSVNSKNSKKSSHIKNSASSDEIDIVPYKCLCPYSNSANDEKFGNLKLNLKKLTKFVQNIPCDRPGPVNLYRHLRNYHKVDLQNAKDITRTIMINKPKDTNNHLSFDDNNTKSVPSIKTKKSTNEYKASSSLANININTTKCEGKNELNEFLFANELPDDWDGSIPNIDESIFLEFDDGKLIDDIEIEQNF